LAVKIKGKISEKVLSRRSDFLVLIGSCKASAGINPQITQGSFPFLSYTRVG
jgi:hypothetical protein